MDLLPDSTTLNLHFELELTKTLSCYACNSTSKIIQDKTRSIGLAISESMQASNFKSLFRGALESKVMDESWICSGCGLEQRTGVVNILTQIMFD